MIAIAMACTPTMLIADEPTTALDVTIQAQILDLMLELKERTGAAVMLITHDLGVIAETAQRVVVMYAGRKVEEAPVKALFARPRHPYTRGLMTLDPAAQSRGRGDGAPAPADRDSRRRAIAHRRRRGLHVRTALPLRERAVPRRAIRRRSKPRPGTSSPAGTPIRCRRSRVPEASNTDAAGARGRRAGQALSGARRTARRARWARCRRSTASRSALPPARRWGSSARAAAASRPPARRSCVSSSPRAARSGWRARTSRDSTAPRCARAGAGCR